MSEKKKYGLIIPKKNDGIQQKRKLTAFNSSDEEIEKDERTTESVIDWAESSIRNSGNSGQKSLQRKLLREALKEDATVFQYDDVYDEMKSNEDAQAKAKKKEEAKKPKYINTILHHAEKRKIDLEKRQERKIQKEREAEGDEFIDKEAFVTSSYLKKLEELAKHDKAEQLEKLREEKDDVLKHKNFNRFYNSLYKMKMGEDIEIKTEKSITDENSAISSVDSSSGKGTIHKKDKILTTKKKDKDNSCSDIEIKQEPMDSAEQGSDVSDKEDIDSVSNKSTSKSSKDILAEHNEVSKENRKSSSESEKVKHIKSPRSRDEEKKKKMKENQEKFKQLFTKRTIGEKFDEAVQRYFERKANQSIMI